MKRFVYLAGAILGCDTAEANDWRHIVGEDLRRRSDGMIVGISPLRCEPIIGERYGVNYTDERFGTPRAIASKNLYDMKTCDMTLAYMPQMPEGRERSGGTMWEMGAIAMADKPLLLVSTDPYILSHPCFTARAGWLLPTLDDAVDVLIGVLGGYTGGKNV